MEMRSPVRVTKLFRRWAALTQLTFLEANSRGARRFTGISRGRRIAQSVALWALGPMLPIAMLDVLALHRDSLWWCLAGAAGVWALTLFGFLAVITSTSVFRATHLRSEQDRRGLASYPRYPRRKRLRG